MASVVDICNQALGWVGGTLITQFNAPENTKEWALCNANYAYLRDAVLEDAEWTFAIKRVILTPLTAEPAWGYQKAFLLPADTIRLLEVKLNEMSDIRDVIWEKEGETIVADAEQLFVRYIARIEDPNLFSPNFIQALAARMAAEFAIPLAANRQLQADMTAIYRSKRQTAANLDGMQSLNRRVATTRLKRVRRQHRGGGFAS